MQNSVTLGFLLLCALASTITSARIRNYGRAPDFDEDEDCEDSVRKRIADITDRINAYHDQCGMIDETHVYYDAKMRKHLLSDEGYELLCEESCRSLKAFAKDAPDSHELIRECRGHPLLETIQIHDTFDATRKWCEEEEMLSPLLDNVEEDTDIVDNMGVEVDPEIETIDSPKIEPEVVNYDVDPNVVDVPVKSPVAPMKGNKVKQMKFEYEFKAVMASRNQPSCAKLKKVFKDCDYKRTGEVFFSQIDNMLDKMLPTEKVETTNILKDLYEKVKKDPETQPTTFEDWKFFKMGSEEAANCALDYATQS